MTPKEIDYSKTDAATKGDTTPAVCGHRRLVRSDGRGQQSQLPALAGSPAGDQARRTSGVYGKPGEQNGVMLSYGVTNEAAAKDEALGTKDSPDGVLFNCMFNPDRLEGDSLTRAVVTSASMSPICALRCRATRMRRSSSWNTTPGV